MPLLENNPLIELICSLHWRTDDEKKEVQIDIKKWQFKNSVRQHYSVVLEYIRALLWCIKK